MVARVQLQAAGSILCFLKHRWITPDLPSKGDPLTKGSESHPISWPSVCVSGYFFLGPWAAWWIRFRNLAGRCGRGYKEVRFGDQWEMLCPWLWHILLTGSTPALEACLDIKTQAFGSSTHLSANICCEQTSVENKLCARHCLDPGGRAEWDRHGSWSPGNVDWVRGQRTQHTSIKTNPTCTHCCV